MNLTPTTLTGKFVRLEPLDFVHAAGLAANAGEADVWEHLAMTPLQTEALAREFIARTQAERTRGEMITFAIVPQATGIAAGTTSYLDISVPDRRVEIGRTWLAKACWRTAINTEAKRLLLAHAFETLGCLRVQLKTDNRNLRSQRAIERLGAVKEGVLRAHMQRRDGTQRDTVMYSITAEEWPAVRARLDGFLAR